MKLRNRTGVLKPLPYAPPSVGTHARSRRRMMLVILNLVASLLVAGGIFFVTATGFGLLPPLGPAFNPGTGVWTMASDAQTPVDETLHLPGLDKPVQIAFESNGTAHINATTDHDMFMTIGYLHASFRLFQMDLERREAEGLLSAIVGPPALGSDEFEDQLGLLRTAEANWARMTPDDPARQALIAYTGGVNAVIDQDKRTGNLPLLFKVLGYQPASWTPIDSLAIQEDLDRRLSYTSAPLNYALLVNTLGYQRMMAWFPIIALNEQHPYDPGPYSPATVAPIDQNVNVSVSASEAQAALAVLDEYNALPPTAIHHDSNSNAWVVDGTMTASGMPLLAGDPHLAQTLPAIWYQIEARSPGYQFAGVSVPGLPIILIGRNQHISWSLTNGQNETTLYYQEKVDPVGHPHQYFWNGAWRPMKEIHYQIPVKGSSPVDYAVDLTVHGPVLTQSGETLSMWWVGSIPSNDLDSILSVTQASNFQQFRDALRGWHVPTQNFVYADNQGNIGAISAGYYPQVKSGQPWLPLPGTGESDVIGTIPFDDLPQVYDPPSHFIVAANQRPVTAAYPYFIGTSLDFFDPGYRADEIYHMLSGAQNLTVADMERMQNDFHDYEAQQLVPKILDALDQGTLTPQQEQAANLLRSWNDALTADSAAGNIFNRFVRQYVYDTFEPWWDHFHASQTTAEGSILNVLPDQSTELGEILQEDVNAWTINDPTNPAFSLPNGTKRTAPDVIRQAFADTVVALAKKLGSNPQTWAYGRGHSWQFPSLAQIDSLSYGPRPAGGNARTINSAINGQVQGIAIGGATWRFIMDWGTGQGIGVYPGGQSENPMSPWYGNQINAWWNGQYYPMLIGDQVASQQGVHTWTIQP